MTDTVVTVSQLTRSIKSTLEGVFPFVWVKGEVSNLSKPASGHLYFTLKDSDAMLSAVWFKGQQKNEEHFDPLTGEVYEDGPRPGFADHIQNGQEIVCAGRLTVYPPRGSYQMVVELAQDAGQGRLQQEFERLKKALAQKGYFAQERKRVLPKNPAKVAVVTAATGAAVRDFLRMANERGVGSEIRVYPVLVQGNDAPAQIAAALKHISATGWADVVALIRGGGSLEDLWAFNTELVAEAVFTSAIPIVCGVGHEVDVSIADLTADVRAATPTHAAQLLWVERRELAQNLDETELALTQSWQRYMRQKLEQTDAMVRALTWLSPEKTLARWEERLTTAHERLSRAMSRVLERPEQSITQLETQLAHVLQTNLMHVEQTHSSLTLRLSALDPYGPLERGYALARKSDGTFLRSRNDAHSGDAIDLILHDGEIAVTVTGDTQKDAS